MSGSTFTDNVATDGQGGAIYNTLGYSTGVRTVTNCVFIGNQATSGGGAIYSNPTYGGSGAGLVLTVSGSTFTSNAATGGDGGGLYNDGGTTTLTNCTVSGNSASQQRRRPGQLHGTTTLTNCIVSGNSAILHGGGLSSYGNLTVLGSTLTGNPPRQKRLSTTAWAAVGSKPFPGTWQGYRLRVQQQSDDGPAAVPSAASSNVSLNVSGSTFTGNVARGWRKRSRDRMRP